MTSKWEIAAVLASLPHIVWTWCFVARLFMRDFKRSAPRWVGWIFFECRPFIPALIATRFICTAVVSGADGAGWRIAFLAMDVAVWWWSRREKDDDDRWKKRAAKVADSVRDLGHRLVVVPGGAR